MKKIPVIDLFAGPGGLAEGFSSIIKERQRVFDIKLSIEKEESAHKTLELRSFCRQFPKDKLPEEYYAVLKETDLKNREEKKRQLFEKFDKEYATAKKEAWLAELGNKNYPPSQVDQRIKDALKELEKTIELNNWKNPVDDITYQWYTTRFINEATIYKKDEIWLVRIEVNQTLKDLMQLKGNWTELDLVKYLNKFRTKYAMKLYEYLKSFSNYRYLDISQKHLMKLLNIEENKTYKNYSDLERLINRQIKELSSKSDLTELELIQSKTLKKEKTFRFSLDKNAKNKTPEKQKVEDMLNNSIRRF